MTIEIRLGDDEPGDRRCHDQERHADPPRSDAVPVRAKPRAEIQDDRELRELRGLEADDRRDAQPACRTSHADADTRNEHRDEQDRRHHQERSCEQAKSAVVESRGDEHRCQAERRPGGLLRQVRAGVVVRVERGDAARAVDHRQPEQEERQHDDEKRKVVRRRPRQASSHRDTGATNWRTSAANRLPRSSAEENMSNEAHAGDSNATSPGWATSRIAATASSSESAVFTTRR